MKFNGMLYAGLAFSIGCVHHEHRVYVEHHEPDRVIVEEPVPPADVVVVREAPPPDRVEEIPEGRPGAYWIRGHYIHDGREYVWMAGHWVREPHEGAEWAPGHWVHGRGGYFWVEGHWR
jgi:hypothetical protein